MLATAASALLSFQGPTPAPARPAAAQMSTSSIGGASAAGSSNLFVAAATRVAEISIVGLDQRAARESMRARLGPLRALSRRAERAANSIVMKASASPPRIADVIASKESFGDESLFPVHVIGDYGFDPLGLATAETLVPFREAEIKHARLAMLAAVAWPLQEVLHPIFVDAMYSGAGRTVTDVLLESNGASPSLVNGGLTQPEVLPALALTILGGAFLEEIDIRKREDLGLAFNEYPNGRQAGNLGFDPLNVYRSLSLSEKLGMHERELLNGRLAMLAVASYVASEFATGMPVVRSTSFLFEPLILNPGFRAFMDGAFGMASMDGAINGVAF